MTSYAELAYMMEAQERLSNIMDTATASGTLKKGVGPSHMRALRRQATRFSYQQGTTDRKPQELTREAVEAMGIEVVNG